jgi:ferredoxin
MKVKFIKETNIKKEKTILDIAEDLNVKIKESCGGKGKCGKCVVKVVSGEVSELSKAEKKLLDEEEISKGYRLACETEIKGDVEIELL